MPWIGHRAGWLVTGALVALVPALWMWGFTVDDALISVRYARHVLHGVGWRFDAMGPATDGVTPLPWPAVLAPLAWGGALGVLARAKLVGLVAWTAAAAGLGSAVGRLEGEAAARADDGVTRRAARAAWKGLPLLVLALSVPVAAHAVSGMETAVATALATFAVLSSGRPMRAAVLAGLAAAFRPEMAPWACVLAAGVTIVARPGSPAIATSSRAGAEGSDGARFRPGHAVAAAGVALAPFAACALVRVVVWGRPSPLALMAKPSDVDHGLAYAGAALVVTLLPVLVVAPFALVRAARAGGPSARAVVFVFAAVVHMLAVVAVGGDWMPYARLVVPVLPSLALAAALLAPYAHPVATAARGAVALALGVVLVARGGTDGRRVGPDRTALVEAAAPALAPFHRVASLDVGWVSAATEGEILDLAGVTDPAIASLPGGHTSKRVDARLLLDRGVDAVLLYLPRGLPGGDVARWPEAVYERAVEYRLATDPTLRSHFEAARWLPLGERGAGYVLLRARAGALPPTDDARKPAPATGEPASGAL